MNAEWDSWRVKNIQIWAFFRKRTFSAPDKSGENLWVWVGVNKFTVLPIGRLLKVFSGSIGAIDNASSSSHSQIVFHTSQETFNVPCVMEDSSLTLASGGKVYKNKTLVWAIIDDLRPTFWATSDTKAEIWMSHSSVKIYRGRKIFRGDKILSF